jgi:MoxR-like ATPase
VLDPTTHELRVVRGPVFTHLLLADEINRAPAKTQSALLEVMQERQVTIGRETFKVPNPFLVLATQNPIETEGTYALPEAQIDRFMLKVLVGYPSRSEEFVIVERMTGPLLAIQQVLSTDELLAMQAAADRVYVDPALFEYAVRLSTATRNPEEHGLAELKPYISFGASPRASINLILTARALAFVRGRDYALPEDVLDMALDILRHRIVLSFEALSDDVTSDALLRTILDRIPVPVVPLRDHGNVHVRA